jgi:hypothetical protein
MPAIPDFSSTTDEERKACKQSQSHEPWECDPIVEPNKLWGNPAMFRRLVEAKNRALRTAA